jgi:hypothetical protein
VCVFIVYVYRFLVFDTCSASNIELWISKCMLFICSPSSLALYIYIYIYIYVTFLMCSDVSLSDHRYDLHLYFHVNDPNSVCG